MNTLKQYKICYIDGTDWLHELGEGCDGVKVYKSITDTLQGEPCATECGVVQVKVEFIKWAKKSVPFKDRKLTSLDDTQLQVLLQQKQILLNKIEVIDAKLQQIDNTTKNNIQIICLPKLKIKVIKDNQTFTINFKDDVLVELDTELTIPVFQQKYFEQVILNNENNLQWPNGLIINLQQMIDNISTKKRRKKK